MCSKDLKGILMAFNRPVKKHAIVHVRILLPT